MKIINSNVPQVIQNFWELSQKPKAIAASKTIARKRDRARMRLLATKELQQEQLADMAEKKEEARMERERAYHDLMRKVSQSSRRQESRRKSFKRRAAKVQDQDYDYLLHIGEPRLDFSVQQSNGENGYRLLASCAID